MAVKHLDMAEVSGKELAALSNEVQTLKGLQHENIVQYLGCDFSTTTDDRDEKSPMSQNEKSIDTKFSTASSGMLPDHPAINGEVLGNRSFGTFSIFLEYVSGGSVRLVTETRSAK